MKTSRKNNKGFTLIELGIAVAISILLALAAVPYFNSRLPVYEIQNSTTEVASYLRMLRNQAISRNETLSFKFIPGNYQFRIYDEDNTILRTLDINKYSHGKVSFGSNSGFFNGQGQLLASSTKMDYTTLTISITDDRTSEAREIRINSNGRISSRES